MEKSNELIKNYAKSASATLFRRVYLWMTLALTITGFVALYVARSYTLLEMMLQNQFMFWGVLIADVALVMYISVRINRISVTTATLLFIVYAVLNGITMSTLFVIYTASSIASTFFITAGTFGTMALIGSFTRKDLTKLGSICIMGVIRTDYRFSGESVPSQFHDDPDYFVHRCPALRRADCLRCTENQKTPFG